MRARAVMLWTCVLLAGAHGTALAHATLVRAEPAAGAHLTACPARVLLVFSEPLEPSLARMSVAGGNGRRVALAPVGDPHDVHAVTAPVECLPAGGYRVSWRVVSADGHPVEGNYTFDISGADPSPAAPVASLPPVAHEESPSWGPTVSGAPVIPAVLRGLALGALMSLAGMLVF